MNQTESSLIAAYAGGFVYTTSNAAITTEHAGVKVVGNSVISAWTDSDGNDLVAKFGISGVTLTSAFPPLIIPGGLKSTSIRLAATNGGICLIKG